jgi:predicted secreted protein
MQRGGDIGLAELAELPEFDPDRMYVDPVCVFASRGLRNAGVALAAIVLLAAGCGSSEPAFTPDDGTIRVEAGERFRVELEANPGVGDDWRLVGEPARAVAELVGESFVSESDAPGSGGTAVFTFSATEEGAAELVFFNCYRCAGADRPTPENEPFSETVSLELEVLP